MRALPGRLPEGRGSNLRRQSGAAVVAEMKKLPTKDVVFGEGSVREDGRRLLDMYLFEVKKREESKGAWDYYKLLAK